MLGFAAILICNANVIVEDKCAIICNANFDPHCAQNKNGTKKTLGNPCNIDRLNCLEESGNILINTLYL